jgi:hypothetical protein
MSSSQIPAQLAHFSRLNRSIWYHESALPSNTKEPDLILLVGWMEASPRHLSKYSAGYEDLYPAASIAVITTVATDTALSTDAMNAKRLKPVLEILYGLPEGSKVLLHMFSNGGAFTAGDIAVEYKKRKGMTLPIASMILDSSPGKGTFAATVRAFAVGLPKNPVLNFLGTTMLKVAWVLIVLGYFVQGRVDIVENTRRRLNDKTLFDVDTPRMYIYSVSDIMVDWKMVEEHAEEAKSLGYTVDCEKYLETKHCSHFLVDPEKYWKIVQRLWSTVA